MLGGVSVNDFEASLNSILVDTFNNVLKFEEMSLRTISNIPVTVSEAHLLEAISNKGGSATVSKSSSQLKISLPTVTVAIKKLESKGLVTKVTCESDGRRAIISLTELGLKLNKAHSFFHRRMVKNISSGFTDEEKKILLATIKKLSGFFKEKVEDKI